MIATNRYYQRLRALIIGSKTIVSLKAERFAAGQSVPPPPVWRRFAGALAAALLTGLGLVERTAAREPAMPLLRLVRGQGLVGRFCKKLASLERVCRKHGYSRALPSSVLPKDLELSECRGVPTRRGCD